MRSAANRGPGEGDHSRAALAAVGGMHSTRADLATLLRVCLAGPAGIPLDAAIRATVRPPRADA
jgi:hypothetical protein